MSSEAATAHPKGLAHHFETYEQQKETSFLGMWLFICQEVMFFGGAFAVYVNYRVMHPEAMIAGSQQLNVFIGAMNTLVLLCSSFTMVYAVWSAQSGFEVKRWKNSSSKFFRKMGSNGGQIVLGLVGTLFFGTIFLVVKYFEYGEKFAHHLVPGHGFIPPVSGIDNPAATEIFFSLYFAMTGLHALHMVVGMVIMLVMIPLALKGKWDQKNHNFVEGFGLYWHFVDIVWIFLFPFLYLIGESVAKFT